VFRVDLRLRAEGSVGQLARSLEDYRKYYATRGQIWERLALVKAWPVAGSGAVGKAFLNIVRSFIFGTSTLKPGLSAAMGIIEDVRAVKEMIDAKMAGRGHEHRNVKLGTGGIREIEFLLQTIQVLAGKESPALVNRSTLGSLKAFAAEKILSAKQEGALRDAYLFLRDVEHKLQMVHDLQTHSLPDEALELERCAIRSGYAITDRRTAVNRFQADLRAHTKFVNDLFRSFFYDPLASPLVKVALKAMKCRALSQGPKRRSRSLESER